MPKGSRKEITKCDTLPLIKSLNQLWFPSYTSDSKSLQGITLSPPVRRFWHRPPSLIWPSGFSHITWQPQSAGSPPLLAHQEPQFGRRAPQMREVHTASQWDERYTASQLYVLEAYLYFTFEPGSAESLPDLPVLNSLVRATSQQKPK